MLRSRLLLPLVLAAAVLGACSSPAATSGPTLPALTPGATMPSASDLESLGTAGMAALCDSWQNVSTSWPPADAGAALQIGPFFSAWAADPAFASIAPELTTVFNWIATASVSTSASTPTADVQAAFDKVKAFADANC